MTIRTLSQLEQVSQIGAGDLFEVSHKNGETYSSMNTTYGILSQQLSTLVSNGIGTRYSLNNGSTPIDVDSLRKTVVALSSENMTGNNAISGTKQLTNWPYVQDINGSNPAFPSPEDRNYSQYLASVGKVQQMIEANPIYISTEDSRIQEGNPFPENGSKLNYSTTIGIGKFYFWQIGNGATDSSTFIVDPKSGTRAQYQEIRQNGNLVMWGWIADNGEMSPQEAWVGLFSAIKDAGDGGNTRQEFVVPVQINPWIRGANANIFQYVSFGIPVKKGLKLKVMTGFPVNGNASGFQQGNTLTFKDRWIPNAFYGYVIS